MHCPSPGSSSAPAGAWRSPSRSMPVRIWTTSSERHARISGSMCFTSRWSPSWPPSPPARLQGMVDYVEPDESLLRGREVSGDMHAQRRRPARGDSLTDRRSTCHIIIGAKEQLVGRLTLGVTWLLYAAGAVVLAGFADGCGGSAFTDVSD